MAGERDPTSEDRNGAHTISDKHRFPLLLLSVALFAVGSGGTLLNRVYFLHGGRRLWLSSLVQIVGWPVILLPLSILYLSRRLRQRRPPQQEDGKAAGVVLVTRRIAAACVGIGVLGGLDAYLYAYGSWLLPVSTSNIIISTQLAFTALFAFLLVGQRFTAYSVNAVFLLVLGALALGVQPGGSAAPEGEAKGRYLLGFFMTLGAAALYGLILPVIEYVFVRMEQRVTYWLVMEMQVLANVAATLFCLGGMIVNKDFQAIPREAKAYGLGEAKYYTVLVLGALSWQCFNLGYVGIVSCSSSLLAGIVLAVLIPAGQIFAVILLHERFSGVKGISLALALWGFGSYLYGDWKQQKKTRKHDAQIELPLNP